MEFRRILVPVAGTEADEEAMELAGRLLSKKEKGKVCAFHVIPIGRALPLDIEIEPAIKEAEELLAHIEDVAAKRGCKIETDLLQAREVAPAIVNEALARESDLIIIGAAYKERFGKFSLGDIVPYVLENAPCRVIIYHRPAV